jgi:hypothetical protein
MWYIDGIDNLEKTFAYLRFHKPTGLKIQASGYTIDPQSENLIESQEMEMVAKKLEKTPPPQRYAKLGGIRKPKCPPQICICGSKIKRPPMERWEVCPNCGLVYGDH